MNRFLLKSGILILGIGSALYWGNLINVSSQSLAGRGQISEIQMVNPVGELPAGTFAGSFAPWVQVNDDAFGLGDPSQQTPPYQDEDVFETIVFHDQLYLGMEADNLLGARLWRTRPGVAIPDDQSDWEEVAADPEGYPFGIRDTAKADHIDSLAVFDDRLYVSLANRSGSPSGTSVFRSIDGLGWTPVISDGFGTPANENFKDMLNFSIDGTTWLCGGTWNDQVGSQFWCTQDGSNWIQKNQDGFGESQYRTTWSAVVFGDYLYVGTSCDQNGAQAGGDCPGSVFRTDGTATPDGRWAWEKVFTAPENQRVMVMGPYQGNLFLGFQSSNGTQIYTSPSGGAGTFANVVADGFGNPRNGLIATDGDVVYNGAFYISVVNQDSGLEIWRTTDSIHWSQVVSGGLGDSRTIGSNLVVFNGYLYAWAENYFSGQKVFRSKCPIVEEMNISGPGVYDFQGVGTVITLTSSKLDRISVGVYPDAYPLNSRGFPMVKRHFEITASPPEAVFTATMTVTFTEQEFGPGSTSMANKYVYLASREAPEARWSPCFVSPPGSDRLNQAVTCSDLHHFSTWAILADPYQFFLPLTLAGG